MRFQNNQELLNYIENIQVSDFEINFTKINEGLTESEILKATPSTRPLIESVALHSLASRPLVNVLVDTTVTENVLYVDEFESIPFTCSTGKVSLLGTSLYMNLCESDGTGPVVHMDILVNETVHHNIPFKLKKSEEKSYILVLNPDTLNV